MKPLPPKIGSVLMTVERQRNKLHLMTKYLLTLSEGSVFLLYGMKRLWNVSANYLITQNSKILDKKAPGYLGKTRSNWDGTFYTIYDKNLNPKKGNPDPDDVRC